MNMVNSTSPGVGLYDMPCETVIALNQYSLQYFDKLIWFLLRSKVILCNAMFIGIHFVFYLNLYC